MAENIEQIYVADHLTEIPAIRPLEDALSNLRGIARHSTITPRVPSYMIGRIELSYHTQKSGLRVPGIYLYSLDNELLAYALGPNYRWVIHQDGLLRKSKTQKSRERVEKRSTMYF